MKLAIAGATGVTGALVADALAPDAELVRLRRGAVDLQGARVVIGCAGPVEELVAAAIAARAHYVDIATEQGFLRAVYERFESPARKARVCVVPGMGVQGALGDLAAACAAAQLCGVAPEPGDELCADDPLDEITVTYLYDRFAPTPGSARSTRAALAGPGYTWRLGRWDVIAPGAERLRVAERDATSFPSGEVITVPRHVAVARVQTFASFERSGWLARATSILSPALPLISRVMPPAIAAGLAEPAAADPASRAAAALEARAATTFQIVATARRRDEHATVSVSGQDVYATTARIVAWAALELAARTDLPHGVLAPSEVWPAREALDEIADAAGLTVET